MPLSNDGNFITGVYTKVTDTRLYTNFNAHTPENYKVSVAKTLVSKALKFCSIWDICHAGLDRFRQIFLNNDYLFCLMDEIFMNKLKHNFDYKTEAKINKLLCAALQFIKLQKQHTSPQPNHQVPRLSRCDNAQVCVNPFKRTFQDCIILFNATKD